MLLILNAQENNGDWIEMLKYVGLFVFNPYLLLDNWCMVIVIKNKNVKLTSNLGCSYAQQVYILST